MIATSHHYSPPVHRQPRRPLQQMTGRLSAWCAGTWISAVMLVKRLCTCVCSSPSNNPSSATSRSHCSTNFLDSASTTTRTTSITVPYYYYNSSRGDWKRGTGKRGTIKNAGVENAGLENAGPNRMGGNRRTGKRRTSFAGVENAGQPSMEREMFTYA